MARTRGAARAAAAGTAAGTAVTAAPVARATRTNPVVAHRLWCILCFRHAAGQKDIDATSPFSVDCVWDAVSSILCRHCCVNKSTCDPILKGMNGDAADLSALIRWAETFWGATSGQNWDGGDFRQDLNDAMLRLCDAFDTAYKAHQAAFHLGGAKKTKVEETSEYRDFVNKRAKLLTAAYPGVFGNTPVQQQALREQRRLRLEEGDEGHTSWIAAKLAYRDEVNVACDNYPVDATAADGGAGELAARRNYIMNTFPLTLGDI